MCRGERCVEVNDVSRDQVSLDHAGEVSFSVDDK